MSTLNRYLLRETAVLFAAGFGLFLTAFCAVDSVSSVARQIASLGLVQFGWYLVLRALTFQTLVVPLSVLLAALLCLNRMMERGEVLGLLTCGISQRRLAHPILLFSALSALSSLALSEGLASWAARRAALLTASASQGQGVFFRGQFQGPEALPDGRERLLMIHSLDLETATMHGVVAHFFFEGRRVEELYAESARWDGMSWRLSSVRRTVYGSDQEPSVETSLHELSTASGIFGPLPEASQLLRLKGDVESIRSLWRKLASNQEKSSAAVASRRADLLELHQRLALAFSSVVLAFIAIPIALTGDRQQLGGCLAVTVGIALAYYLFTTVAGALVLGGTLAPWLGAWLANLLFGALGLLVFSRRLPR